MTENPYQLPDLQIKNGPPTDGFFLWQPDKTYLILGRSNNSGEALIQSKVVEDKIDVMQRPSGGETVILSPKMLVIAAQLPITKGITSRTYFTFCNDFIITALQNLGVQNLSTRGISDISIGEKKILGSAIYRGSDTVFYHAVLNISEDISLISKYIKHPKREPDYRNGRSHDEFVTSLHREGYSLKTVDITKELKKVSGLPQLLQNLAL
ncbi:MAG: hypothetical protein JXR34_05625 [Bacteroidales bacterium]|nr:hypothetical protein [Bacteroidales bacterium]